MVGTAGPGAVGTAVGMVDEEGTVLVMALVRRHTKSACNDADLFFVLW